MTRRAFLQLIVGLAAAALLRVNGRKAQARVDKPEHYGEAFGFPLELPAYFSPNIVRPPKPLWRKLYIPFVKG